LKLRVEAELKKFDYGIAVFPLFTGQQ